MRILITNDDGIAAAGLVSLARVASRFGEVKVIAPDRERSACAHAMTMRDPLRVKRVPWPPGRDEASQWDPAPSGRGSIIEAFEVNGLPVDCVNVGLCEAWPDGCDLVLSGFNHGPNLGFDVTYSGTVAGAMEGAINGIMSISLSMALFVEGAPLHLETGERWLEENWETLLSLPRKPLTFLNVNVPAIDATQIRGTRIVGMGQRVYEDRVERREDPWGRPYYWQGGVVVMDRTVPNTDVNAVAEGFVSVTPVTLDWTDHELAQRMRHRFAVASE